MELLQTLVISTLFAGLITFLLPNNNKVFSIDQKPNTVTINTPKQSTSSILLSLLNNSELDSVNLESELPLILVNKRVILNLPEINSKNLPSNDDKIVLTTPTYWEIVHSIESKQGEMLYRPRNKERSCVKTSSPCGHYQISAQALKDIGCTTTQCKMDRENSETSLTMSKKLEHKNLQRLAKKGYRHLPDYQKYLTHQQGATGITFILDAQKGRYKIDIKLLKSMANNSSYSYKHLKNMGSKIAAQNFLNYWENKWDSEIDMIFDKQLKQQIAIRESLQLANNTIVF